MGKMYLKNKALIFFIYDVLYWSIGDDLHVSKRLDFCWISPFLLLFRNVCRWIFSNSLICQKLFELGNPSDIFDLFSMFIFAWCMVLIQACTTQCQCINQTKPSIGLENIFKPSYKPVFKILYYDFRHSQYEKCSLLKKYHRKLHACPNASSLFCTSHPCFDPFAYISVWKWIIIQYSCKPEYLDL